MSGVLLEGGREIWRKGGGETGDTWRPWFKRGGGGGGVGRSGEVAFAGWDGGWERQQNLSERFQ